MTFHHETEPLFVHDCPNCTFLGHVTHEDTVGDAYYCDHQTSPRYMGSVVWRIGDDGWEYCSFPVETVRRMRQEHLDGEPGAEGSVYEDILNVWEARHA